MIDEGPGEHDAHLLDDDEPSLVVCVSCAAMISAHAVRCHHCGANFVGEAWQQQLAGEGAPRVWWRYVAGLLAIIFILWALRYAIV